MRPFETLCTISPEVKPMVDTGAADHDMLVSLHADLCEGLLTWQRVIDQYLVEWGRSGEPLQDEGITPPTSDAVFMASNLAIGLRDQDAPAPLRVVPDGDGGIVFERRTGATSESIEIHSDGSAELVVLTNSKLSLRRQLN